MLFENLTLHGFVASITKVEDQLGYQVFKPVFKGYLLGRKVVFIKQGQLNQYILKIPFLDCPSPHTY
jgi:hypothetical protein